MRTLRLREVSHWPRGHRLHEGPESERTTVTQGPQTCPCICCLFSVDPSLSPASLHRVRRGKSRSPCTLGGLSAAGSDTKSQARKGHMLSSSSRLQGPPNRPTNCHEFILLPGVQGGGVRISSPEVRPCSGLSSLTARVPAPGLTY